MASKKWRWWTAVLLLIIVIGAVGCGGTSNDAGGTASQTTSQDAQGEQPAAVKKPEMTSEQEKALAKAQTLLLNAGFSKKSLIEALQIADYGDNSKADATFAANNAEANWNQQALEAAALYLEEPGVWSKEPRPLSKDALIRRLTRVEKFTPAQARDAVNKLYGSGGSASQTTPQDSQPEQPAAEKQPATTPGQKQALAEAQTRILNVGLSKKTLIEQLRWSEDTGYSKADATFAADNAEVNWNREALEFAAEYLKNLGPLSKDALFRRLTLVYQFTPAQARDAVNKLY